MNLQKGACFIVRPSTTGGTTTGYYPYGEEQQASTTDGWNFATYYRDASTELDYAVNRYYSSQYGRFISPDPYQASGGPENPQSWNRYAYVLNDPVNYYDPVGLFAAQPHPEQPDFGSIGRPGAIQYPYQAGNIRESDDEAGRPQIGNPKAIYTAAVFSALAALSDPDCAGIFNINSNSATNYNPRDVLASMVFRGTPNGLPAGTSFGSVQFGRLSLGFAAVTQPDPATSVATGQGVKAVSADIVLQSNRLSDGYIGTQLSQDLALTLIHELGHVYNIVSGLGGSKIIWDSNPDGTANGVAENANAKTLEKCHPK